VPDEVGEFLVAFFEVAAPYKRVAIESIILHPRQFNFIGDFIESINPFVPNKGLFPP
jgi:hypothetical protein